MSEFVGRPRLRPRLPVNFGARDLIAFLGQQRLAVPWEWPPEGYDAYLTTSGRASLYLLLKSLGLRPGSGIGVPLFVCDAVFEAVVRAGYRPIFLDVDPTTMVLSPSCPSVEHPIAAVVAVHLFGNPVDVESISADGVIPVIEDCAHALFSEVRGKQVGTVGIGAVYSFGLGKPISMGELGAVMVPKKTLVEKILSSAEQMPQETRSVNAYRALRSFATSALYRRPWYGMFSYELGRLFEQSLDPMNHDVRKYELSQKGLRGLLQSKFHSYRENLVAQRESWHALSDAIADESVDGITAQAIQKNGVSDSWMFAIRCSSSSQRDALAGTLLRRGVDSIKIYDQVPEIARAHYDYSGDAPEANRLCKTVVGLPVLSSGRVDDSSLPHLLSESVRALQ